MTSLSFSWGIQAVVWGIMLYLLAGHTLALGACLISFRALRHYARRLKSINIESLLQAAGAPPISILVPVHNAPEESLKCIEQLLKLRYPELDIMIINDGSNDHTLETLQKQLQLQPTPRFPVSELPSQPVKTVYQSQKHARLWVIDKERGGMADALNAGLNFCQTPLFCSTYVTMLLERNALLRAVRPFLENAATAAVSGIVRVRNGCLMDQGDVKEVLLPPQHLVRMQILEHLRFFLVSYTAGSSIRSLLLVSGAFAVFRRALVVEAGGYDARFQGETPELLLRLHRFCRESGKAYHVDFIPDPMAWHECPNDLAEVRENRMRWQQAVSKALLHHRALLWSKGSGRIGWLIYPMLLFTEFWEPFLELGGYFLVLLGTLLGWVPPLLALAFFLVALLMGSAPSALAVALGELTPRRYQDEDLRQLLRTAWLEYLGYHQLRTLWRIQAIWGVFSKNKQENRHQSLEF
ncbi:glycosyl transferase [bacterium (Candidatus Blackallbacteria) CG17_big_fil_post_rev_8_21_14_2_50_48_46]|uniref:Glycosyl transferase n=1 Tax=bacterium (Candidatus Blackallbacteria) CG17_big_fil_post_rev_8_21_14_2_50_48_46 TaxID=2014261 RepID=A0A2M7GC82_9BACT|nr:MAG: glycosyl transferase [bacterium (Candidatus Blackallbacteria) CG18_big_fil_WC_8_21_14_2_50_49_26]PIW19553.1 MAG: glycosyl transferase [bacterium (Candidatus Blackallbacteria) CG17_big_fil_post_rev_8_21_14_2_50_48_46]PIW48844.1 MAG: glycosyl transferase [bacterium (Candidatus Blackallbacteria) CG13_big_fil_rev_8_21_14_2_50_49_14]